MVEENNTTRYACSKLFTRFLKKILENGLNLKIKSHRQPDWQPASLWMLRIELWLFSRLTCSNKEASLTVSKPRAERGETNGLGKGLKLFFLTLSPLPLDEAEQLSEFHFLYFKNVVIINSCFPSAMLFQTTHETVIM